MRVPIASKVPAVQRQSECLHFPDITADTGRGEVGFEDPDKE